MTDVSLTPDPKHEAQMQKLRVALLELKIVVPDDFNLTGDVPALLAAIESAALAGRTTAPGPDKPVLPSTIAQLSHQIDQQNAGIRRLSIAAADGQRDSLNRRIAALFDSGRCTQDTRDRLLAESGQTQLSRLGCVETEVAILESLPEGTFGRYRSPVNAGDVSDARAAEIIREMYRHN